MTRPAAFVLSGCLLSATPSFAQLGGLVKGAEMARKANDIRFTEVERQELGAAVSAKIRAKFGVVQDKAVHRYVALVGALVTRVSTKPDYPWRFIVLDTDAVNAFATPGGYVHITKGALALVASEAELAGVLGHEVVHITGDHTIKAIQKGGMVEASASAAGQTGLVGGLVDKVTEVALQGFGRGEELESDKEGAALASKAGYAPSGLPDFLKRLQERNKASTGKRGLFASHPQMEERLDKLAKQTGRLSGEATLEPRYKKFVSYQPVPQSAIATVAAGSAGLAGSGTNGKSAEASAKDADKPAAKSEEPPKKKGFGLGGLASSLGGGEKKSAQVTASGGSRGLDPEVDARGGANPAAVSITLTAADIDAFRKEGKLT
jgi:predicted Zn-dependent protease